MPDPKNGPLTAADLQAIWVSATDESYNRAILDAGDGAGLEVYGQMFAQLARAASAIDATTQACYILPWSGQSGPPAAGEQAATVALTFTRSGLVHLPLLLAKGRIVVEEMTTDWGDNGPVEVLTGRRYVLAEDVVIMPGATGPVTAAAVADVVGAGHNNPLPGTITVIDQVGPGFYHDRASVLVVAGATPPAVPPPSYAARVATVNEADTFVPEHVGQYVRFVAGANVGAVARIVAFFPPQPSATPPLGSTVTIEYLGAVAVPSIAGTFLPGELLTLKDSGAVVVGYGVFVAADARHVAYVLSSGAAAAGGSITGALSAATATVSTVLAAPSFTAEAPPAGGASGGAAWRVLDWGVDWGLSATNAANPVGGRLGMLDAIGEERNLPRTSGEGDDAYRKRVHQVSDVVSPGAVTRALTRTMGGLPFCFREVGSPLLPGIYYDRTGDPAGDFYDDDVFLFTGFRFSGAFVDPMSVGGYQEVLDIRDGAGNLVASGYLGYLTVPNVIPGFAFSGSLLVFIRTDGAGTATNPMPGAGDITGRTTGAIFSIASLVSNPAGQAKRNHVYFDYADFRAYFRVGVPRVGFGEFGFAYDNHPRGAYDAAPFSDFYDGFPVGALAFYKRVYEAVERVRADGVGWDLYLEDGTCS